MPGVLAVLSDPRMLRNPAQGTAGKAPVQGPDEIFYFGQPIALVVAESFEQARHAAQSLHPTFDILDGPTDPEDPGRRAGAAEGQAERPGRHRRGDGEGRLHRRPDLAHPRPRQRRDGAARRHRRLGRRHAGAARQLPDAQVQPQRARRRPRHQAEAHPPALALRRRWLRVQARHLARGRRRGARRARARPAGHGRPLPAAGLRGHHAPLRDPPAHPPRRRPGRPPDRHLPREPGLQPAGRELFRAGRPGDALPLRRRQSPGRPRGCPGAPDLRRLGACARARRSASPCSRTRWTSWPRRQASIRSTCVCATSPRVTPRRTSPSPPTPSPRRCIAAPSGSAGAAARRPAQSATANGRSASASPRRSGSTC